MRSRISLSSMRLIGGTGANPGHTRNSKVSASVDMFKLKTQPMFRTKLEFGLNAPKYTIPNAGRTGEPLAPGPGPGKYNPDPVDHRLKIKFPQGNDPVIDPVTKGIHPYRHPGIGDRLDIRKNRIHERTQEELFDIRDTPGPKYNLPTTMDTHSHKILPRESFIVEQKDIPPVASYTPQWVAIPHGPAYTVPNNSKRGEWITDGVEETPGPGAYTAQEAKPRGPTFGAKSRKQKPAQSEQTLMVIDRIPVNLGKFVNAAKVKKYVHNHPELVQFVHEMFELVLNEKPENPVEFLRQTYGAEVEVTKPSADEFCSVDDVESITDSDSDSDSDSD